MTKCFDMLSSFWRGIEPPLPPPCPRESPARGPGHRVLGHRRQPPSSPPPRGGVGIATTIPGGSRRRDPDGAPGSMPPTRAVLSGDKRASVASDVRQKFPLPPATPIQTYEAPGIGAGEVSWGGMLPGAGCVVGCEVKPTSPPRVYFV